MVLTKEDLDVLSKMMDEKIWGVKDSVDSLKTKFDELETRFDGLETRFDGLETRFDGLEAKVDKIDLRLTKVEFVQENEILPRLQNIEDCYISTFERYKEKSEKIEEIGADVEVLKKVVYEHSKKLGMIS